MRKKHSKESPTITVVGSKQPTATTTNKSTRSFLQPQTYRFGSGFHFVNMMITTETKYQKVSERIAKAISTALKKDGTTPTSFNIKNALTSEAELKRLAKIATLEDRLEIQSLIALRGEPRDEIIETINSFHQQ